MRRRHIDPSTLRLRKTPPRGFAGREVPHRGRIDNAEARPTSHREGETLWAVPTVHANLGDHCTIGCDRWWPIRGRWHEDGDVIGFEQWHWHVDWRFVTGKLREEVLEWMQVRDRKPNAVVPRVITGRDMTIARDAGREPTPVRLAGWPRRQYLRTWLLAKVDEPELTWEGIWPMWEGALAQRYRHARITPGRNARCPHRGVDLSDVEPDEDGVIECPLHGLRWCANTGDQAQA